MNAFEYAAPTTKEQAVNLLSAQWGETEVLAGGTDLLSLMKDYLTTPKRVVNIKDIKELPRHLMRQIRSFFEDYKNLEHKKVIVERFGGAAAARKVVKEALWYYAKEERSLRSGRPVVGKG